MMQGEKLSPDEPKARQGMLEINDYRLLLTL